MRSPTVILFPLLAVASALQLGSPRPEISDTHSTVARDIVSLESRDLASQIWNDIKNDATCAGCQSLLGLLKAVLLLGNTVFIDTVTEICKASKTQNAAVCEGSVALEGPVIAQAIRNIALGSTSSELLCIELLGLCSYPAQSTAQIPFPRPKPASARPTPSSQQPIQVVAITDIHVDQFYVTNSSTDCGYPMCCRDYNAADSPGGSNSSMAGPNGDHNCDSPVSLEMNMYNAINEIAPNASLVIFTGDIVDHAVWNTTQAQNSFDISDAYNRMHVFNKPVYGTIGNHEPSPVNSLQTISQGNAEQWVYAEHGEAWGPWIGAANTSSSVQTFGAYAVNHPDSNLVVISINTNLWFAQNYYLYQAKMEADPNGQIAWLVQQLDAAEAAGQRVYIIGHTPPGSSDIFHDQSGYFSQIVDRYQNVISANIFGHTHYDQFEISYSNYVNSTYDQATAINYVLPAMVPTSGMPAFRVFDVDPETWLILDSTTYLADMTNPAFQTTGPVWTKLYSAAEVYGPLVEPPLAPGAELSPAFWHNLTVAFSNNLTAYNDYVARKTRGWDVPACDGGSCRASDVCSMRAANAAFNCHTPTPGFNFKRDTVTDGHNGGHHECGLSVTGQVFGQIGSNKDVLDMFVEAANRHVASASQSTGSD